MGDVAMWMLIALLIILIGFVINVIITIIDRVLNVGCFKIKDIGLFYSSEEIAPEPLGVLNVVLWPIFMPILLVGFAIAYTFKFVHDYVYKPLLNAYGDKEFFTTKSYRAKKVLYKERDSE